MAPLMCVGCRNDNDCEGAFECEGIGTSSANCVPGAIVPVEGMDLVLQGYDIFLSDPLRTKGITDEGIQDTLVFKHDYENSRKHADGVTWPKRYAVSDDYPVCESKYHSKSIKSTNELKVQMEMSVSIEAQGTVEADGVPIDIAGSVGAGCYAKSTSNAMKRDMTVSSTARCETKVLVMNDYSSYPDLSDGLTTWLARFFNTEHNMYVKLFEIYGTHIVRRLTIGAVFGATSVVTESQISSLKEAGANYESTISAGVPVLGCSAKVSNSLKGSIESKNSLEKAGITATIWSIGGNPASTTDDFRAGALHNPAPLKYEDLVSLCEVIDTKNIQNFDKESCFKAYIPYCKDVMKYTEYNCDAMQKGVNLSFDCIFDEHCNLKMDEGEKSNMCIKGQCRHVKGFKVSGPTDYDHTHVSSFKYEGDMARSTTMNLGRNTVRQLKFCHMGEEYLWGNYYVSNDYNHKFVIMDYEMDKNWNAVGHGGDGQGGGTENKDYIVNNVSAEPEKYFLVVTRDQSCDGLGF